VPLALKYVNADEDAELMMAGTFNNQY